MTDLVLPAPATVTIPVSGGVAPGAAGLAGAVFGWLLAYLQVPSAAVEFLQSFAHSKLAVLLLIIVVLLLLGTFMDLAPLILICTPIFLPVARAYGIDPIHFGLVLVLTMGSTINGTRSWITLGGHRKGMEIRVVRRSRAPADEARALLERGIAGDEEFGFGNADARQRPPDRRPGLPPRPRR